MTSVLYDVPGPRARRRTLIGTVVGGALLLGLLALVLTTLAGQGMFDAERWQIFSDPAVWQTLLTGLGATLKVAAVGALLASLLGIGVTALRGSPSRWLRAPTRVYIELFRGLPVLLLMFFPIVLFRELTPFHGAVIGLTLYNSAVIAEILRSGIATLPRGQREAGLAIGLSEIRTMLLIELPQAIRIMLPSLISQLVVLLKDSSLAYIITYPELLRSILRLRDYFGGDYLFPLFVVGAGIYIAVNFAFSTLATWLSARSSKRTPKAPAGR